MSKFKEYMETVGQTKSINESFNRQVEMELMVDEIFGGDYKKAFEEVVQGMSDDEAESAAEYIRRMYS